MSFGDRLFQLAQGIIQNEQRRKQLELQEERQKVEIQQAERSLSFRAKELEARQGFLKVQQEQAELSLNEAKDPETARKRKLENDFFEARIAHMRAETAKLESGTTDSASVSEQLRLGQERERIAKRARTARADATLDSILVNGAESAPLGIDGNAILSGIQDGIRTVEGLDAAIESAERRVGQIENSRATAAAREKRLAEVNDELDRLRAARREIDKVYQPDASLQEFQMSSPHPQSLTQSLYENGRSRGSLKLDIWGQSVFNSTTSRMLDEGLSALREGNPELLKQFILLQPAGLLNADGALTPDGRTKLGPLLFSEGVSTKNALALISSLSAPRQ